jgi:hypothetical protein
MTISQRRSDCIKKVGCGKETRPFSSFYGFKKPHGKMWLIIILTGSNGVLWLGAIVFLIQEDVVYHEKFNGGFLAIWNYLANRGSRECRQCAKHLAP